MKRASTYLSLILLIFLAQACGPNTPAFNKNPVDDLIKNMSDVSNFDIILYDMNFDEATEHYLHQYRILKEPSGSDTILSETTEWMQVSPDYFNKHVDDMGMTIVSKTNGTVDKKVSPPGYNQYVGNEKYGQWNQKSDGTSFWEFYGKYAFLRSVLGFGYSPIYYGGWNDYRRNYYPYGRTYYGNSNGGNRYGTNSAHNRNRSSASTWSNKNQSFKNRVRSQAQRSTSRTSRSSRRSRSGSRYSGGSSSRGRGFSGGK